MNFSWPFIRRPIGTTLMAIGLFMIGAVAYTFLPVSSLPSVDLSTISVTASRPGADPNIMAATVAAPLERRLGEISGVTELTSVSSLGSSRITVQFDLSRSIEGAARDVQADYAAAYYDCMHDDGSRTAYGAPPPGYGYGPPPPGYYPPPGYGYGYPYPYPYPYYGPSLYFGFGGRGWGHHGWHHR